VFENRALSRIFEPKGDEVTGVWRKLHNEEHHDMYCSPNVVQVIKSKRMRWVGHVALTGEGEAYTGFVWGNLRERDYWGNPGVDGREILRWIFRKWDVRARRGSNWLRTGTSGGHLECGKGSVKCGEYLD
jgi:hypothetical protein